MAAKRDIAHSIVALLAATFAMVVSAIFALPACFAYATTSQQMTEYRPYNHLDIKPVTPAELEPIAPEGIGRAEGIIVEDIVSPMSDDGSSALYDTTQDVHLLAACFVAIFPMAHFVIAAVKDAARNKKRARRVVRTGRLEESVYMPQYARTPASARIPATARTTVPALPTHVAARKAPSAGYAMVIAPTARTTRTTYCSGAFQGVRMPEPQARRQSLRQPQRVAACYSY